MQFIENFYIKILIKICNEKKKLNTKQIILKKFNILRRNRLVNVIVFKPLGLGGKRNSLFNTCIGTLYK